MAYYLGKLKKDEYLLLKDQKIIKFSIKTKTFQPNKKFFQNNYLNVLNPDNFIYNLEQDIDNFIKISHPDYTLKSNIIFDNKQFIQFKINNDLVFDANIELILDIEVDKIKFNIKNNLYQIMFKLISWKKVE